MIGTRCVSLIGLVLVAAGRPMPAQSSSSLAETLTVTRHQDSGSLLSRPARFEVENVSLEEGLVALQRSSGVSIAFSPSLSAMRRDVSCACAHLTVGEVLEHILRDLPLRFAELNGQVLIEPQPLRNPRGSVTLASANPWLRATTPQPVVHTVVIQGGVVAGTVVDIRARPIEGARVMVTGTSRETVSDGAGRFRIVNLSAREVALQVVRIGFRNRTLTATVGDTTVRVVLAESAVNLDEIVVTGTAGRQERRAVGNAVSAIDASEITRVAPVKSVGDLLKGRASSVVVTEVAGVVGAGPQLYIRGRGSLSLSSEPLIYIDGVRVNNSVATGPNINASEPNISRLGDLDPDEIESIEVIKGPAAATLYGTEASNGVIQIITKKGTVTARPAVELTVRQGANWFMDADGRIEPNFGVDAVTGEIIEQDLLAQEAARGQPLFRTGHLQAYDVNMRGGSSLIQYFVSTGFDREEGIEPTNDFRRLNGRANITVSPSDAIDITANFGVVNARRNLSLDRGLSLLFGLQFGLPALQDTPTRGFFAGPPEFWWNAFDTFQDVQRYITGLSINHRPFSWLRHRLTVGMDQSVADNQVISELQTGDLRQFLGAADRNGRKIVNRVNEAVNTVDYGATATARLNDWLSSSTSVGAQYYRNFAESQYSEGRGFPAPGITTVSAAAQTFGGDDFIENVTIGSYVQQQFSFNDRIFLTGALRADDNSAFGGDFEIVTYPKASATWVVSEEPFWNVGFVDALRLRGAYGQSGLQPGAFDALRTYRATTGGQGAAVSPLALGNPDLAPERGEEIELGFEAGLLGGRVGIDFTYYTKRTKDMILRRSPAPSSGFSASQFFNAGEVSNKGTELLLDVTPIESRSVSWNLAFSFSTNSNEIVDLDPDNPDLTFIGGTIRHAEGGPVGAFYERRVVSATLNPATGIAEDIMCDPGPDGTSPVPCADAPSVLRDQPIPKWEGGFTNTLRLFDRLTLHAQLDFRGGHFLRDETNWARCAIFQACEINVRPEQFDPIDVAYAQLRLRGPFVSPADFLKLREVSLTLDFPDRWARGIGAERASITVAGRNLHTWTAYTGLDPESAASTSIRGFNYYEQTTTPQLAGFITTVRVTW